MADGYGRVSGRAGGVQRPPGAGADERSHRADRGRQEPDAAGPARGRDAQRGGALELPHRPDRPGRGGGSRRPSAFTARPRRWPTSPARCAARASSAARWCSMLPLDVQAGSAPTARRRGRRPGARAAGARPRPSPRSPTCWPARGARPSSPAAARCSRAPAPALRALGELTGAVLATSAVANGLFAGDPYDLGISGGFASPLAARLLGEADVVVAFGAALNQWTTGHGKLLGARRGRRAGRPRRGGDRRPPPGDARAWSATPRRPPRRCWRRSRGARRPAPRAARPTLAAQIAARRWRDEPYDESRTAGVLDPRTLSIALDDLLPAERTVVVDSGAFMGWPVDVPARARRGRLRVPAGLPVRRPRRSATRSGRRSRGPTA